MNKAATGGHCFPACVQTFSIYINLNDTILKPEKKKQFLEGCFWQRQQSSLQLDGKQKTERWQASESRTPGVSTRAQQ